MRRDKGFSLLEILIAFAIMAVAITIVLRVFGSGVNNALVSEEYTLAIQIAESLMARTGVETPLQAGETSGSEADKYDWQVVVSPVALSEVAVPKDDQSQNGPSLQLLSVKVRVAWGDEESTPRAIELKSLKTSQVEASGG
ncbi:MAG: prepilin-type N-terminal cleavage/methylation domain-containing protein [Methylococcaceae bacterium]|nr:prepilin-type N-terminal cleavage/methylation domain-containing protein [Methylococcaceae bacterium]